MTEQQQRPPGYRGALPPRGDRLARPWIATVLIVFILIFVLSLANVPSRFLKAASSPTPVPAASASASALASASVSPSSPESAVPSPEQSVAASP